MPRRNSRKKMENSSFLYKSDVEISRDLAADRGEYLEMNNLAQEPKKTAKLRGK